MKASGKPIVWEKEKVGDVYSTGSAPRIAGKEFLIDATVQGNSSQGIIVAHGGSAAGYSLYIKEGRAVFAVRYSSARLDRIAASLSDAGMHHIRAVGNKAGVLRLTIDDTEPMTQEASGLLSTHPQEDLCIGHDDRNPVDVESPRKPFTGKIVGLKVVVAPKPQ